MFFFGYHSHNRMKKIEDEHTYAQSNHHWIYVKDDITYVCNAETFFCNEDFCATSECQKDE